MNSVYGNSVIIANYSEFYRHLYMVLQAVKVQQYFC